MNWHSIGEFFAMGGYGLYVWGAYGAAALLMATEAALVTARRRRAAEHALDAEEDLA